MFENIIGQEKTTGILCREIEERRLPRAILIHGEPYSGKLSIALEMARVLACPKGGVWSCACRSCASHRLLTHPGTLLLGSRGWLAEIRAAEDTLRRTRAQSARYLYLRSVRKLTRRCDPDLWVGAESRMRPAFAAAAEIAALLEEIEPGTELAEPQALDRVMEKIAAKAVQVAGALPRDNTPVGVIRKAAFWARMSAVGGGRTVVLENADRMLDSSRNALLKLLEEPPVGVYLILLCTNPRALPPTVLSRVRRYPLVARPPALVEEVLRRVFRVEDPHVPSLADYFRVWEGVPVQATAEAARLFLETARSKVMDERPVLAAYAACQSKTGLDAAAFYREFCRTLLEQMLAAARDGSVETGTLARWRRVTQTIARDQVELNLQPQLALQATLYGLREAVA